MLNMHIASLSWSFFLKTKLFHINVVYCEPKFPSILLPGTFKNCLPELHITTFKRTWNTVVFFSVSPCLNPYLVWHNLKEDIQLPAPPLRQKEKGLTGVHHCGLSGAGLRGLVSVSWLRARTGTVAWHGGKSGALKGVAPADIPDSWRILQTCRHLGKRWEVEGHNRNGTLMALRRSQGKTDKPQHLEGAMYTTGLGGTKHASPGKMYAQKMPEMTWSLYWADSW